jgi:hypothetical protein
MASDNDDDDGRAVYGTAIRTNKGVYKLPTDTNWKWEPNMLLTVQKDSALAANNAINALWDGAETVDGMCSAHTSLIWFIHNKHFFRDAKTNNLLLQIDFENYKRTCPRLQVVPVMLGKMLEKWKKVHKEKTVTLKWASSWESTITTRVEMNTQNLLCAGIPTDNNAIEGSNRWDKSLFNYS